MRVAYESNIVLLEDAKLLTKKNPKRSHVSVIKINKDNFFEIGLNLIFVPGLQIVEY